MSSNRRGAVMAKLAIVATLKTTPGRRDEYLPHLKAHGERCRKTEPGTLKFKIMLPHDDPDTILLYELYESVPAPLAWTLDQAGPSSPCFYSTRSQRVPLRLTTSPCVSCWGRSCSL